MLIPSGWPLSRWTFETVSIQLKQKPVDAHIIDKVLATTGLLAQVLVAKSADHLPLYRQESIYALAGIPLARSTLAHWVGSCGVQP